MNKCLSLPELNVEIYYFPHLLQSFPPHFHDAHMLGCLLAGKRESELKNAREILSQGDCMAVPAGIAHGCRAVESKSCAWICLHIRKWAAFYPDATRFADSRLNELFRQLEADILANCHHTRQIAQGILAYLADKGPSSPPAARKPFSSVCEEINNNLAKKTSLAELAKNLDKYKFLRLFQSSEGITPYRYLEAARITSCQTMLRGGEDLANCALRSGFYDQSHFSRCFKSRIGVAPGAYRSAYVASRP